MKWIDSYAHFRNFSAQDSNGLKNPIANWTFDKFTKFLNSTPVNSVYTKYQDVVNLRDNRFVSAEKNFINRSLVTISMVTNLPFSAAKDENDLLASMGKNRFDHAIVINLEPFSKASTLLQVCNGKKYLTPVVNLEADSVGSFEQRFEAAIHHGARGIAVHPILERKQATDPHYLKCASLAAYHGVPMVCRTGVTSYPGGYDENASEISNYEKLVSQNKRTTFIMSHSNLVDYKRAIEFAQKHENVFLDTAWQTQESIQRIINGVGADRVLLASDWPLLGDQQKVQRRIFSKLHITDSELEKIVYFNPKKLYNLDV